MLCEEYEFIKDKENWFKEERHVLQFHLQTSKDSENNIQL